MAEPKKDSYQSWMTFAIVGLGLILVAYRGSQAPMTSETLPDSDILFPSRRIVGEAWTNPEAALHDYVFLRDRVMDEYAWDMERAEATIVEYLRFMEMLAESPRMELIASTDVDLVWHEHIMDTTNYANDCITLFGQFLHHRRARTLAERKAIAGSYEKTKEHYAKRYNVDPPLRFWGATTESASMCGGKPNSNGDTKPADKPQTTEDRLRLVRETLLNGTLTTTALQTTAGAAGLHCFLTIVVMSLSFARWWA